MILAQSSQSHLCGKVGHIQDHWLEAGAKGTAGKARSLCNPARSTWCYSDRQTDVVVPMEAFPKQVRHVHTSLRLCQTQHRPCKNGIMVPTHLPSGSQVMGVLLLSPQAELCHQARTERNPDLPRRIPMCSPGSLGEGMGPLSLPSIQCHISVEGQTLRSCPGQSASCLETSQSTF